MLADQTHLADQMPLDPARQSLIERALPHKVSDRAWQSPNVIRISYIRPGPLPLGAQFTKQLWSSKTRTKSPRHHVGFGTRAGKSADLGIVGILFAAIRLSRMIF